jgi:N-methylhydantoinase B
MIKPLRYIVPEGTILNASYPAATTFGNHLCPQVADAIFKALSEAIPDRITAGWNHLLCSLFTGVHPETDEKYVDICFLGMKGGSGALDQSDGYDHIGMIDASGGVLDQDYEMFEQQTPHKLMQHEYLTDSAGAGKWRGGLGVITAIELGADDTTMVIFGDGDVKPPYGLFGGKDSILNKIAITYPDGKEVVPMSKDMIEGIPAGTVYHQVASGGGGYGYPEERNREKVLKDVRNGVVSPEQAQEIYKIKLDED